VLGLTPGASAQEAKAAYRDLAKVWHPDRFAHDPRLQRKAEEQLKGINDAYQRLVSGDFARPNARTRRDTHTAQSSPPPRAAHTPPHAAGSDAKHDRTHEARATATTVDERVATRTPRRVSRAVIVAPALVFCATFAFITPRLLSTARAPEQSGDAATVNSTARDGNNESAAPPADPVSAAAETTDSRAQRKTQTTNQTTNRQHPAQAAESATAAPPQPVRAMPTVTVLVDPTTGLRARASCPNKTAMTFPAGDEPSRYCDAHNAPPPQRAAAADESPAKDRDGSRLKSLANGIASPAKKLFGGRSSSDKKSAPADAAPRN
jgi:hypothetical protein